MQESALLSEQARRRTPESVSISRLALLYALFFSICLGLEYPSLNRVDRMTAPGLTDVQGYATIAAGGPASDVEELVRFRVLVPYLARPIYRAVSGHTGSWDTVMLALLVVDSAFVAGTAILLLVIMIPVAGSYPVALGSALIYMLNFAVPNLRLAGFIDAGEGFFLIAVVWCLMKGRYWVLPVAGVLGAMAKETFVPYLMAFTAAWWLSSRSERGRSRGALWVVASWGCALVSISAVHWAVRGSYSSLVGFGMEHRGGMSYAQAFLHSFADRNLYYIFFWLLPLSLVGLGRFPKEWRMGTAAAVATAFALVTFVGGVSGIGRALFDVAGPLLSASVAMLLFGEFAAVKETRAAEN